MLVAHGWLTENSLRSYPLTEEATKVSSEGVELPDGLIVDLFLTVPETVTYPCRISQISYTGRLVSLVIRDAVDIVLGAVTVDAGQEGEYVTAAIHSSSQRDVGTVTLGPARAELAGVWPIGNLDFGTDGAVLEASTCPPLEVGPVTSLGIQGQAVVLRDDVKLIPGTNIALEYDFDENAILIRVMSVETAFLPDCESGCVPEQCARTPIQTINGVGGTAFGCNFFIEGAGVVSVTTRDDTIVIGSSVIKPADLCPNYTKAPDGEPGAPGAAGSRGGGGGLVCEPVNDCYGLIGVPAGATDSNTTTPSAEDCAKLP